MSRMHHIGQKIAKAMVIATQISNFVEVYRYVLFGYPLRKICLREGITIHAPEGIQLWNHFNDIWLYGTYTAGGYDIKEGSIVIDIGANIGLFSMFAARSAKKIYSFEPFPPIYDYLVRNVNNNKLYNVTCFQSAVGAVSEKRVLYLQPEATANSFYVQPRGPQDQLQEVVVECKTLQEVLDMNGIDRCDFLKLDCEGSEFEIVFGTSRSYLAKIGIISVECHNGVTEYTHVDLQNYLESIGFVTEVTLIRDNTVILKGRNANC